MIQIKLLKSLLIRGKLEGGEYSCLPLLLGARDIL